jgi:hypothetical protein
MSLVTQTPGNKCVECMFLNGDDTVYWVPLSTKDGLQAIHFGKEVARRMLGKAALAENAPTFHVCYADPPHAAFKSSDWVRPGTAVALRIAYPARPATHEVYPYSSVACMRRSEYVAVNWPSEKNAFPKPTSSKTFMMCEPPLVSSFATAAVVTTAAAAVVYMQVESIFKGGTAYIGVTISAEPCFEPGSAVEKYKWRLTANNSVETELMACWFALLKLADAQYYGPGITRVWLGTPSLVAVQVLRRLERKVVPPRPGLKFPDDNNPKTLVPPHDGGYTQRLMDTLVVGVAAESSDCQHPASASRFPLGVKAVWSMQPQTLRWAVSGKGPCETYPINSKPIHGYTSLTPPVCVKKC